MSLNRTLPVAVFLAVLALLPYAPLLQVQPLISDDYLQIHLGRTYGPVDSWARLAVDPLYRCRATSILLTHWTEMFAGVSPVALYWTAMILHIACTWLVWLCGRATGLANAAAVSGAAVFAVYEGHQEAVMWYASLPELLLFFFCGLFVLCWLRWMKEWEVRWYLAASACFALALLSKESAVVLVPAGAALLWRSQARVRKYLFLVPLCAVSVWYAWGIFAASRDHLHLNDGTFSFHSPFVITWLRSSFRMLWFWGLAALLWLALRRKLAGSALAPAAFWMAVALVPYCFLTYMPHVPSRHVYLASAGLCLIVGAALVDVLPRQKLAMVLFAAIVAHNTGYIWVFKRAQFLERAEPTEKLLRDARRHPERPIRMCRFPYGREVAERAIQVMLDEPPQNLKWDDAACNVSR